MRIRLVLAAYPNGSRRAEIEDTLLMAAANGRGRLGVRSVINLLRHGLRARLGRPDSYGVVALAAFVAVMGCLLLASAANRLAWEAVPDLPAGAARAELGALIAPGPPVTWNEDASSEPFPTTDGQLHAQRISADVVGVTDVGGYLAGLEQRLQVEGWRVPEFYAADPAEAQPNDSRFLLARDGTLILSVVSEHDAAAQASRLDVEVYRAEPRWVSALTFAAGLLGGLLGWLVFGWASRRTEHRRAATAAAFVPAVLGLVLLVPALSLGMTFLNVLADGYAAGVPFWAGLAPSHEYGFLAISAGVAFGATLLVAACCRPGLDTERAATA